MSSRRKILTVFGTRPEAIKLFPLVHALEEDERFDSRVRISAQHREMLDQVLDIAGIVPDHDLDLMTPGQTLDALTARALVEIGRVLDAERPDWVVVQGDTTTVMAGAIAAYYRKIPVCHVEAGLRSGDIHHPWPEEVNRRVVGSFAALHCAPTQTARDALLRENVEAATVHVTGNTVIDALRWVTRRVSEEPALAAGLAELEARFAGKRIIGMTSHRRENFGEGMENIAAAVQRLAARDDVAIIFPVHLNPNVRAVMNARLAGLDNVALIEPLDYPHFARLLDISHLMGPTNLMWWWSAAELPALAWPGKQQAAGCARFWWNRRTFPGVPPAGPQRWCMVAFGTWAAGITVLPGTPCASGNG